MLELIKPKLYEYEVVAPLICVQQQLSTVFNAGPLDRVVAADPIFSGFFLDNEQLTFIIRTSGGWVHSKTAYRGTLHKVDDSKTKVILKSDLMISRYVFVLLVVSGLVKGLDYVTRQPIAFWFEGTTWLWLLIITIAALFVRGMYMGLDEALKVAFERTVLKKNDRQT